MDQVRVRMYRPGGIGDCFLLSFPGDDRGYSHVLIDCGVLKGTRDANAIREVADHILQTTKRHIDVLVVTHEHWDHVSGFLQVQDKFKDLKVDEVWLAWTEDPEHELANDLREQKARARKAVDSARQKLRLSLAPGGEASAGPGAGAAPAVEASLEALAGLGMFGGDFGELGAAGGRGTAAAMKWAREGTGAPVRYLAPGPKPVQMPGAPNIRAFVLGPPEDRDVLKRGDPSKKTPEVYQLAAGGQWAFMAALAGADGQAGGGSAAQDAGRPFDSSFERPAKSDRVKEDPFFKTRYFEGEPWRQIDLDWLATAELLALQLDSDTNNTSLVLAFELTSGGPVLLFPGDAQVGNWLSWGPLAWTIKSLDGERTVTTRDLLARTVLYKVGHHGSHNATLREQGLELMQSRQLAAMISVYQEQAKKQGKGGWEMPFDPLLCRLKEKTSGRILRADLGLPADVDMGQQAVETEMYIDYFIDL